MTKPPNHAQPYNAVAATISPYLILAKIKSNATQPNLTKLPRPQNTNKANADRAPNSEYAVLCPTFLA